jgi:hypothetical protein
VTKQKVDAQQANEKKSDDVENASAGSVQSGAQEDSGAEEGAGEPGAQPGLEPDPNAPSVASGTQTTPVFSDVERELIGSVVVEKLREILPPILEASLPDLIAKLLPETPEQKTAREKAESAAQAAEDASNARKEQARRDRSEAKQREAAAEKRHAAQGEAAKAYDRLFGGSPDANGFKAEHVEKAVLVLDDGKAFCIDFAKEIDAAQLVQADEMLRLSAKIDLPSDIPAFTVRGVSLQVGQDLAMRCEIPTPLHIGEGRKAELAADSLIFRAPVKPVAETA